MVEIDHGNSWVTRYGHNANLLVSYGDEVKKGQTVAVYGGNDPAGSGPHLHYAMLYNKKPVNPLDYLEPTAKMNVLKKK
jgi:murein DD-endopeptidase MepM/ murein hydrolase activator NlpD